MSLCYKELRNGPCGGSRVDGSCEVDPNKPCIWNVTYDNALAAGDDPTKFGRVLVPPRNWSLNHTNAMANHLVGLDNTTRRRKVGIVARGSDGASAPEPPRTDVDQRLDGDQEADKADNETQEVRDGSKRR